MLTPSCWPGGGGTFPGGWEACLLPVPGRCGWRACAGGPLPPCGELTLPLPPQQETAGGGPQLPSTPQKDLPPHPGAGVFVVNAHCGPPAGPLGHPDGHQDSRHSPFPASTTGSALLSLNLLLCLNGRMLEAHEVLPYQKHQMQNQAGGRLWPPPGSPTPTSAPSALQATSPP